MKNDVGSLVFRLWSYVCGDRLFLILCLPKNNQLQNGSEATDFKISCEPG